MTATVVALVVVAGHARAQKTPEPVTFVVTTPDKAVKIDREYRPPNKTFITHVALEAGEPTWMPDIPGLPQLPFVTRVVALPLKSKVESLKVTLGESTLLPDVALVAWGQLPWPGRAPGGLSKLYGGPEYLFNPGPEEVPPDPSIGTQKVWPAQMVDLADTRTVGGYQLLTYRVCPFQWYPDSSTLAIQTSIGVEISYTDATPLPPQTYAEAMEIEAVKARVVNPGTLGHVDPLSFPPGPDTRYLIITDNYRWDSHGHRGASVGDMIGEFRRLAEWKSRKGVKAAVVSIDDIVYDRYGQFTDGARDLQEVIRSFLKFANRNWSTYWVLLGGNAWIIPPREVAAQVGIREIYLFPSARYPNCSDCSTYSFDTATSTVRIHQLDIIRDDTRIISVNNGKPFARLATGTAPSSTNPGWAFTNSTFTDETNQGQSAYILLRGALADIQGTDFYVSAYLETVPTDLYYASLLGPDYGLSGLHDWDKNNNGLYGQYNNGDAGAVDGVSFTANIALGRAPVASAAEAKAFVDKVIAYEQYVDVADEFGEKLLFTSDNFYGPPPAVPSGASPPPPRRYFSAAGSSTAVIHFEGPPGPRPGEFRLIAWNSSGDWWQVPYNENANATTLGYFYCTDDTCSEVSRLSVDLPRHRVEAARATAFVTVTGPPDQVHPTQFYFDPLGPDDSMAQKEQARALLAQKAPGLDLRARLYKDLLDTPGYPAADLDMLSEPAAQAALNTGYNIVSMSGHGWLGGCCGVSSGWAPALSNGFAGGLIYAESCLTNEFNKPKPDGAETDALGELIVKNAHGGVAAYVGNSRESLIGTGSSFERLFWSQLDRTRRVGVLHNSKDGATAEVNQRWVNFTLNLMGDPEMPLWLGRPIPLHVTHDREVESTSLLPVQVATLAGDPVAGAVACLTGPRGVFAVARTDSGGAASVSTSGTTPGDELTVTVTADGYFPYQGTVVVRNTPRVRRMLHSHR